MSDTQPVGTLASNDPRIPDDFLSDSHRPPSSVVPKNSAVWAVLRLAVSTAWTVLRVLVSAVRRLDRLLLKLAGGPKNIIPYRLVQVVVAGVMAAGLVITLQTKPVTTTQNLVAEEEQQHQGSAEQTRTDDTRKPEVAAASSAIPGASDGTIARTPLSKYPFFYP